MALPPGVLGGSEAVAIDMRIDHAGTWYYHGSPINRKELVRLFAGVLKRAPDGSYWLITPVERCRVTVDDAPFVCVELNIEAPGPDQVLHFVTNLGNTATADADHPICIRNDPRTGDARPYLRLEDDGTEALISRPVYYELVELGQPEKHGHEEVYGIRSRRTFFSLGPWDGGA